MKLTTTPIYELHPTESRLVACDDDNLGYAWFAERNGATRYVTFTRAYDANHVYLERDDQAWSSYNGIERIIFDQQRLVLVIRKDSVQKMGGVMEVVIDCSDIPPAKQAELSSLLRQLFAGTDVPVVIR